MSSGLAMAYGPLYPPQYPHPSMPVYPWIAEPSTTPIPYTNTPTSEQESSAEVVARVLKDLSTLSTRLAENTKLKGKINRLLREFTGMIADILCV